MVALAATTSGTRSHTVTGLSGQNGERFKFIVRAINSIGTSVNSAEYEIIAASTPDAPVSFLRDEVNTSKTQVAFSWSAPPDNGGSPIIDYAVDMDDNNDGVYEEVASAVTSAQHT